VKIEPMNVVKSNSLIRNTGDSIGSKSSGKFHSPLSAAASRQAKVMDSLAGWCSSTDIPVLGPS
jgi:hypothetical protein